MRKSSISVIAILELCIIYKVINLKSRANCIRRTISTNIVNSFNVNLINRLQNNNKKYIMMNKQSIFGNLVHRKRLGICNSRLSITLGMLVIVVIVCTVYIKRLLKKLELEKEKAKMANNNKNEFLAKMSHEIRTPLTAIMGYINILRQSENIKDKEKEQLKIIYNSSNILFQLVNDILDFSKIEVGKLSLIEKEFNVKEMINNAVNMIGIMAKEKQLEFLVHIDGEIPTYIFGDERRLEQVLINIMSNAVKFTQEGHIKLYIEARYFDDKVKMDFIVSDTGKGMDADKLDKIFEAFQQEDNSISKDYGGTGLGLYISRDFIKRMNGDIKVISNAGQGSKFEFYTIHRVGNQEDISGSNILKEGISDEIKGKKILVVEDNEVNQLMIRDILMNMELTVVLANNGVEAIEIANKYFDFILMDIQMPKMDGISAVKLLKQNEDLKEIPIIAFSANAMPEQIKTYIKAGFDGYCTKPIIIKDLQRVLIEAHKNSCKIDTIRIY